MTDDLRLQIQRAQEDFHARTVQDYVNLLLTVAVTVQVADTSGNLTTRAGVSRTWVIEKGARQPKAVWGRVVNPGVPVLLIRIPGDELMIIATFLPDATDTWGEGAITVGMPPIDGRLLNILVPGNRYAPGLVTLPSTIDGLHVFINGLEHERGVFLSQLYPLVAPSSGSQAWIGVGVNQSTNLPVQYLGQNRTLAYTPDAGDAAAEFNGRWDSDDVPLAAVLVANGTTTLSSSNVIVDLRRKFPAAGAVNLDRILTNDDGDVLTDDDGNVLYS